MSRQFAGSSGVMLIPTWLPRDDDEHLTLVYAGKHLSDRDFVHMTRTVVDIARAAVPQQCEVMDESRFGPQRTQWGWVIEATPDMLLWRDQLVRYNASEYQGWKPHILKSKSPNAPDLLGTYVVFDRIEVWHKGQRLSFPLVGGY